MSNEGTIDYKEIISSGFPTQSEQIEGVDAVTIPAGTAVGIVTASGKFDEYDGAGAGGLEVLYGFLINDFDSTVVTGQSDAVIVSGALNQNKLIFAGADTVATTKNAARALGIYYKDVK